jgi:hypothetical protein
MRANRILIPLLIVATLTFDLVLVSFLTDRSRWPDPLVAVLLGLAAGQVTLAMLWGVLGRDHLPWRIAVPLIVPLAWGLAILLSQGKVIPAYRAPVEMAVRLLMQSASLTLILLLIRWHGARLLHCEPMPSTHPLRRRQFSLRYLFAWLTATAITLSLLKTLFQHVNIAGLFQRWREHLIADFVGVTLGLIFVWLLLDARGRRSKLMAAFVTGLPAACIIGLASWSPRFPALLTLWLTAGSYSAVAFVVLRVAGFRLTWALQEKTAPVSLPRE